MVARAWVLIFLQRLILLDNPACSAELDFDEIRDDINALFKAQVSAVKAEARRSGPGRAELSGIY